MSLTKKLTSVILSLFMVMSFASVAIVPVYADTVETYAQDTIQGSNVLHCFDWSYNNIKAALPDIAKAGYTAVQTSPVQSPKDYNASWTKASEQWWKLYQPLGLSISNGNTWLGTKAELTSLCAEADNYGIKVIVDIVANHLANNGTDGGTYSYLNSGVESDLKNSSYYHTNNTKTNDNNRYNITQYHLGMPDLNTGNNYVQQKALGLLEECIDCGVDGFRFDAAKHIELPTDDSSFASQFWPTVIDGAKSYASTKGVDEPFFYGEILGGAGTDISNYTTYMAVTDNYTGDRALDKAYWKAASELADSTYYKGASASNSVLWVESHDTYMGSSGSAWTGNTSSVTSDVINKAWAIVGARADSTALFFARPNDTMGAASSDTNWKSTAVAAVNKFKNHFAGTSEYIASSGNSAYIERGTKGVVISKLDGAGEVSLTAHQMEDGTYTDQVSGNTFTVSNGTISGTVDSSGVAVVYNPNDTVLDYITASTLYLNPERESWKQGNERYAIYLYNYATDTNAWVSMSDSDSDGIYSANVPSGNWTNVIFCRMNGSTTENNWDNKWNQTVDLYPEGENDFFTITDHDSSETDKYIGTWSVFEVQETTETTEPTTAEPTTTEPDSDTYTVYAYNKPGWSSMNVYYWGSSSTNPDWPGVAMNQGNKVFTAEIPSDVDGIIFNSGAGGDKNQTVDITGSSYIKDNAHIYINASVNNAKCTVSENPTYYLIGSISSWGVNDDYAFSLSPSADGKVQYMLSNVTLSSGAELKVIDSQNNWYPGGTDNNYTVSTAGTYNVYFRPNADGGSGWHESYFYLEAVTEPVETYTVTWKNYDGTVLEVDENVEEGETPTYDGEDPTKPADFDYTYSFSGWNPEISEVSADVTYTAEFEQTAVPKYNISALNVIGWDNVYVYYWNSESDNNWPGTPMTGDDDSFAFTASIPSNVEGVIFNNGDTDSMKQTENVTDGIEDDASWVIYNLYSAELETPSVSVIKNISYYLVGDMTDWGTAGASEFIINPNPDGGVLEYSLSNVELDEGTQVKALDENGDYYPSGGSESNYTVSSDGTYDIYFRPNRDGNNDWHLGTLYFANVTQYTITWVDGNSQILGTDTVTHGETPSYSSETPTKNADAQYTYTFNNTWLPEVVPATADATYTAQFDSSVNTYNVIWKNYNDEVLDTELYNYGEMPAYKGDSPTRESTAQYEYTFIGWSPAVDMVTREITYTAVYDENVRSYTITWLNDDGSLLDTTQYLYGSLPQHEYPEKQSTDYYHYIFVTWSPEISEVTGDVEYSAVYSQDNHNFAPSQADWTWYGVNQEYNVNDNPSASLHLHCFECNFETDLNVDSNLIVFNITSPESCIDNGTGEYFATVYYNGSEYYSSIPVTIPATGHNYGEPAWDWADDYSSATATFTCANCGDVQTVDADVNASYEDNKVVYTATAFFEGTDYTDTREIERDYFNGHSLTLDGDIGVNYYITLTDEEANNASVEFVWNVEGNEKTFTANLENGYLTYAGNNRYKASCYVAAAEMTYDITATLKVNGETKDSNVYSVKQYAYNLLNEEKYINAYKASETAKGNDAEERYAQLTTLLQSMLDYGARAQVRFERKLSDLANGGYYFFNDSNSPVSASDITLTPSDMREGLSEFGLTYNGSTIVYLSGTSLRHYYTISDADVFARYADSIKLDGKEANYETNGSMIYFEFSNIEVYNLDAKHTITIGEKDYDYYALSYIRNAIGQLSNVNSVELAKATVRYYNAAKQYFS